MKIGNFIEFRTFHRIPQRGIKLMRNYGYVHVGDTFKRDVYGFTLLIGKHGLSISFYNKYHKLVPF